MGGKRDFGVDRVIGKRSLTLTPWVDRGLYLRVVLLALAFAPRAAAQQIRPPVSALSFMAGGQLVAVGSQEGVDCPMVGFENDL